MRYIKKGREPAALREFKRRNRASPELLCYEALGGDVKQALRVQMLREQGALCAYTMIPIGRETVADFHIEHIRPQWRDPANELNYGNMALCAPGGDETRNCEWGAVKKRGAEVDDSNFVSPLNRGCEQRLKFGVEGEVRPSNDSDFAAKRTIDLLALNHDALQSARLVVLSGHGLGAGARRPVTTAQAERLAAAIMKPNNDGLFEPFASRSSRLQNGLHARVANEPRGSRNGRDA